MALPEDIRIEVRGMKVNVFIAEPFDSVFADINLDEAETRELIAILQEAADEVAAFE